MSSVVALNGGPALETREPRPQLIAELERVLEMARSGEVQAVSIAYLHADGCASWVNSGVLGSYSLIGAVARAQHALLHQGLPPE